MVTSAYVYTIVHLSFTLAFPPRASETTMFRRAQTNLVIAVNRGSQET